MEGSNRRTRASVKAPGFDDCGGLMGIVELVVVALLAARALVLTGCGAGGQPRSSARRLAHAADRANERVTIDSTSCDEGVWVAIYKTQPRTALFCRECGSSMHAKVSSQGTRFFAHDRKQLRCSLNGETPMHRLLKSQLAEIIRACGWNAEMEAMPSDSDIGGWRADVLASHHQHARRVAFEVQLAAMTVVEGRERSARYSGDAIETIWLTTKNTPWLWKPPACCVDASVSERGVAARRWVAAGYLPI
ncbi:MAG: competence protein CoiA family protein [Solirubrobacteraceae bacterium]